MKFVALLSGGKDSCYNVVHCTENGHELVAAASLRPPPGQGEMDSFMYQTVGQDAIELVASALEVPLFRRTIHGSAVEQGGEYGDRGGIADRQSNGVDGDETEDMFVLLSEVKAAHPDIQGVSVGAILSNYQRVRVDHVCQRLSLTPLCYLWQRDQRELMSEMVAAGVEAILIKVAGIGLQERHLGKTLAHMESTFHKLHDAYGAHICGEGGEYETLTLDCPAFKKRIAIKETKTIVHSDHAFATVAYLEIKDATLEDKPDTTSLRPTIPPLLDEVALRVQESLNESNDIPQSGPLPESKSVSNIGPRLKANERWAYVSNVDHGGLSTDTISIEEEVIACFNRIKTLLQQCDMLPKHIVNTTLLLSSMDLFPRVNLAYSQYFGTSPPARACVAVQLPGIRVRVACIAFKDDEHALNQRHGLHVQGISYWAPANIGPYSQAITARGQTFVSGQIGLIPRIMSFPSPPSFATEAGLAFQHADRVVAALRDGPTSVIQGVVVWVAGSSHLELGRQAWNAYSQATDKQDVPAAIVAAKSLPKGALIEIQVLAHSNKPEHVLKNTDEDDDNAKVVVETNQDSVVDRRGETVIKWKTRKFGDRGNAHAIAFVRGAAADQDVQSFLRQVTGSEAFPVTVFHHPETPLSWIPQDLACTLIPVEGILSPEGEHWDLAICIHSIA